MVKLSQSYIFLYYQVQCNVPESRSPLRLALLFTPDCYFVKKITKDSCTHPMFCELIKYVIIVLSININCLYVFDA